MKKLQFLSLALFCTLLISGLEIAPKKVYSQSKANFPCSQYPSGVQTPSAKDPAFVDQEAYQKEGATWDYRWEADCSQSCTKTSDCTQNTANQPAVKVNDSNWCFEFSDGNRCMMLTTTDKSLGQDKNASGGKYGSYGAQDAAQSGSGGGGSAGTGSAAAPAGGQNSGLVCQDPKPALESYYDAKVANNLVRFYAIQQHAGGLCVPADLGVQPQINETVNGITGRLLMCSSESGDKLYWMVGTESGLTSVPESQKTAPDWDTIIAGFDHLKAARCKAGLDTGDICKGV